MKYYLHDTSAFDDEKVAELFINFGYEGVGLFYVILEKLGKQEKPVKTEVLKKQLRIGKKLEKCWNFMESIGIISSNNGETFNKQLLNFSEKYQIKKEKTRKKVEQWRINQDNTESVTSYVPPCNHPKVKESKVKESKLNINIPDSLNTDEFIENWNTLLSFKKWQTKPISAIEKSLKCLAKYDIEFALKLLETAISGNNQGIVFPNTDELYQKWLKQKQNDFDNMTTEQKDEYRQKIINGFYSDEKWITGTSAYLKIDEITFKRRLLMFLEKAKATEGIYKPVNEIKEHFINWYNKEKERQTA